MDGWVELARGILIGYQERTTWFAGRDVENQSLCLPYTKFLPSLTLMDRCLIMYHMSIHY
jgi:hypothetical protein